MLVARSVFPLPLSPWQMAQSMAYSFFALSCEAAVGFTGFVDAGAASCAAGPEASVGAGTGTITKRTTADKNRNGFSMAASSVAGVVYRHPVADSIFRPNYKLI